MHPYARPMFGLIAAALVSACQDERKTQFVSACNETLGADAPKVCACIYDRLQPEFSERQMTRISGLFGGDVPAAKQALRSTGIESDIDILDRINVVEGATEGCFADLRS